MNCLSINIQGAGCKNKRSWVRKLCCKHKVNLLAIQETKMEVIDVCIARSFWGNNSFSYVFSPSCGASGGILLLWDLDAIIVNSSHISANFTIIEAIWASSGLPVMFLVIYAPQGAECKRIIWDNLLQIINSFQGECVLMGDFNEVRDETERFGTIFNSNTVRSFNNFIEQADLSDVSMGGSSIYVE